MIYSTDGIISNWQDIESYKERNLYYKLFTGYLFNELLPGYHQNKLSFFNLLRDQLDQNQFGPDEINGIDLGAVLNDFAFSEIHVTFDYHLVQTDKTYKDRGEMSDILIWCDKYFLSIEAKYLSDWTYDKDIVQVQERIVRLKTEPPKRGIQVLLIKSEKWENARKHKNHLGSNFALLKNNQDNLKIPVIITTWEQLMGIIPEKRVQAYLMKQMKRKPNQRLIQTN
ncbi:MAG: hypothetical protein K9G58_11650 [Bacteroidales bacterium]|nr:hypothetical protein [Bacteroidales bacterium]MCF8398818.1 hypothetical protein [Bacteroidales bacterium]